MEHRPAPRVPSLDGFRALAILWVFLLHAWLAGGRPALDGGVFRALVAEGYLGVDVLFILSGFVLFLPAAVNDGRLGPVGAYALRRVARIVPAYYASLVLVLALHRWVTPEAYVPMPWDSASGLWAWVTHLGFFQTYTLSVPVGFGVLPVIWTLTLEATFYALLPLVARAFHRRPLLWLAGSLAAAEIWQQAVAGGLSATSIPTMSTVRLIFSFPSYAGHFALGMACACLFVRLRTAASGRGWSVAMPVVQAATAAALVAFFLHRTAHSPANSTYLVERINGGFVAVLFAALMLSSALAPRWGQWPFANRLLAGLGDASYGVYLSHMLLLGLAATVLGVRGDGSTAVFFQLLFFTIPPALALGWLSCRFVEQPARDWARRRIRFRAKVPDYPPADLVPSTDSQPLVRH